MSRLHRATKHSRKLRMALDGPAGAGKTYTALSLGTVLADNVAVIDTERSSASLYADKFPFDVLELDDFDPRAYIAAIDEVKAAGTYGCLIIDSFSHSWEGTLELKDAVAKRSRSGDSFGAWREVTPIHNQLVDAVLRYPGHVIATMRTKTEYIVEQGPNGKNRPVKIGTAPVQRAGIDFEFDLVGDLDAENNMVISKSRMSTVAGKVINRPGKKLAEELLAWLEDGAPAPEPEAPQELRVDPSAPPAADVPGSGEGNGGPSPTLDADDEARPWAKEIHIQASTFGISDEVLRRVIHDFTGQTSANGVPNRITANRINRALRDFANQGKAS